MLRTLSFCLLLMLIVVAAEAADPDLVLYLPLDEGQGDTTADKSGNRNNGEVEGADWVDGKFGKALEFGNRTLVHIPASNSLHGNIFIEDFTLMAWIKPIPGGNEWGHIWRSVDGAAATQVTLFYNSAGYLSWRGRLAGTWGERALTPNGSVQAEEWSHIAVVGDRTNFKIYINGEEQGTAEFVEMDGEITDYYLGFDDREWDEWFTGAIDEVYILTRALTINEIKEGLDGPIVRIIAVEPGAKLAVTWGSVKQ